MRRQSVEEAWEQSPLIGRVGGAGGLGAPSMHGDGTPVEDPPWDRRALSSQTAPPKQQMFAVRRSRHNGDYAQSGDDGNGDDERTSDQVPLLRRMWFAVLVAGVAALLTAVIVSPSVYASAYAAAHEEALGASERRRLDHRVAHPSYVWYSARSTKTTL